MKPFLKIILIGLVSVLLSFFTFKISKEYIENLHLHYVEENPLTEEERKENSYPEDIDRMISHTIYGPKEMSLPASYEQKDHITYEGLLYVTNNQGKTWIQVPDDDYIGYARVSDYVNTISESNLYLTPEKVSIVYGGRGSENISIMTTNNQGEFWSVGSISKTATHDLENGYENMFIDFVEDGGIGYIVVIREQGTVLAFRSVNTGVTWDFVDANDGLYYEIIAHFGL